MFSAILMHLYIETYDFGGAIIGFVTVMYLLYVQKTKIVAPF